MQDDLLAAFVVVLTGVGHCSLPLTSSRVCVSRLLPAISIVWGIACIAIAAVLLLLPVTACLCFHNVAVIPYGIKCAGNACLIG
jgi:hypothetical protein